MLNANHTRLWIQIEVRPLKCLVASLNPDKKDQEQPTNHSKKPKAPQHQSNPNPPDPDPQRRLNLLQGLLLFAQHCSISSQPVDPVDPVDSGAAQCRAAHRVDRVGAVPGARAGTPRRTAERPGWKRGTERRYRGT